MAFWVLNFTKGGTKDKKQLAAQARKLLEVGLWGIPSGNQLKGKMKPGDQVLAFVGAPERLFVGTATLGSEWHDWSPAEVDQHAPLGPVEPDFKSGVTLKDARVWNDPLPLFPIWGQTQGAKTNPKARWYSGVVALTDADGELILNAAEETPEPSSSAPSAPTAPSGPSPEASFFEATEELRALPSGAKLSEQKTRFSLIDKFVRALGYTEADDLDLGDAVSAGPFLTTFCAPRGSL